MLLARNEQARARFKQPLAHWDADQVVWVDECGIEQDLYRLYARSPRGQRVYYEVTDKRFAPRISLIAAYSQGRLLAPMRFKGHTNTMVFDLWVEHFLVPSLSPKQVVVLDNATFHKSPKTRKLIESAGCTLLFQPAYSPDLNLIEHQWAVLKAGIRAQQQPDITFIQMLDIQINKMSDR